MCSGSDESWDKLMENGDIGVYPSSQSTRQLDTDASLQTRTSILASQHQSVIMHCYTVNWFQYVEI